jgi:phage shock protein A
MAPAWIIEGTRRVAPGPAQRHHRHGLPDPTESVEAVIASAGRAEERFQRIERRAERAIAALRQALGKGGEHAAAGLLDEVAESRAELARIRSAAAEARSRLASSRVGRA